MLKETQMPTIHELIAKRRDVAAQIKALQEELERLDTAVYAMVENVAAMLGPAPSSSPQRISSTWTKAAALSLSERLRAAAVEQNEKLKAGAELHGDAETPSDRRKLWPSVMHILGASDRPVKTRDLLDQLSLLGVDVGGKNPANNLAAHLSSMSAVTSTPEGWVLVNRKR